MNELEGRLFAQPVIAAQRHLFAVAIPQPGSRRLGEMDEPDAARPEILGPLGEIAAVKARMQIHDRHVMARLRER